MESPLVTVVIPVYNMEPYLAASLRSVCNQDYQNLQIIAVDDGSTDKSGSILDQWDDPRLQVLHVPNGGLSSARNLGIEQATGEYLVFFDSDDLLRPNYVSALLNAARDTGADVAVCGLESFADGTTPDLDKRPPKPDGSPRSGGHPGSDAGACAQADAAGNKSANTNANAEANANADANAGAGAQANMGDGQPRLPVNLLTPDQAIDAMYSTDTLAQFTVAWARLLHRRIYRGLRFPVGMIHEDVGTALGVYQQANAVAVVDAPLYLYRDTPGSIMNQEPRWNRLDALKFYERDAHALALEGSEHAVQALHCAFKTAISNLAWFSKSPHMRGDPRFNKLKAHVQGLARRVLANYAQNRRQTEGPQLQARAFWRHPQALWRHPQTLWRQLQSGASSPHLRASSGLTKPKLGSNLPHPSVLEKAILHAFASSPSLALPIYRAALELKQRGN
ncbi:glycosyltransferase family 2 protein [Gleimia hominis]|uniref:Glycosyltransferase family 2 protein n=1 Tax=Gleimia hominis TaxID=595468 RepID=A0ABU3IA21_9ACTO|nr:glycosyltransferase family 2 protein [Gleimia hominis]MDT3767222.1 glycosyltransferase family 2 protein [Gleimia hominis]